jgi:glucose/mannose transport system substrate-binding protein
METAERAFADAVVDPDIQARFAIAKGSTPVRIDAQAGIDSCSQTVLAALDRPDFAVPSPHMRTPPDRVVALWAVFNAFWNDPAMTPEAAIAALRAVR